MAIQIGHRKPLAARGGRRWSCWRRSRTQRTTRSATASSRVNGSAFVGTAMRTVRQDAELLPNVNSSQVGIQGNAITPSTGKNQDDGNLNFNRGDAVAISGQGLPDARLQVA